MNGLPTTGSSAEWAKLFPARVGRDALEVARLRAAGAIVLGKTAADDFAYHGNGTSTLTGQVRNPYDPTGVKTPGGSSAGSAVSVACGIAFAALGTDDGGSNRIPAQFCGVVGMKPTFGLVPRTGVIPTWPYLDTHGPLARTVADAALLLDAIAGPDASDGSRSRRRGRAASLAALRDDALAGARLGLVEAHVPRAQMSAESLAVWDRAVADLRRGRRDRRAVRADGDARDCARLSSPQRRKTRGDVAAERELAGGDGERAVPVFRRRTAATRGATSSADSRAYRAFYDVLPKKWEEMSRLIDQPYERDPAGVSFARSRATVVAQLAATFRAQRIDAMIYPTMPFPAPRAVDPWPDVRTTLGYGNWLGSAGGVGAHRARRRWHAGAQHLVRRTSGQRRARARAGALVRTRVLEIRRAAASAGRLTCARAPGRAQFLTTVMTRITPSLMLLNVHGRPIVARKVPPTHLRPLLTTSFCLVSAESRAITQVVFEELVGRSVPPGSIAWRLTVS